jgi:hypothetical protein
MSPQLAHSILLTFNYRHNLRMSVKHCGLSPELGGFYSQHRLEDLQELTAGWFDMPLFQGWLSTRGFVDTGERSGLVASVPFAAAEKVRFLFALSMALRAGLLKHILTCACLGLGSHLYQVLRMEPTRSLVPGSNISTFRVAFTMPITMLLSA